MMASDLPHAPRLEAGSQWLLPSLALLLLLLFLLSLGLGEAPLSLPSAFGALLAGERNLETLVLLELRLPRTLLGVMVGASLGLAGAAMQGFLRNPLAEPGVIGVSSCAAFGAVVAFYSGLSLTFPLALPLGGIAGACLSVLFLHLLAGRQASTLSLILAGVAINAFAAALTALALNLAPNPYAALEIVFWIMGSLADRTMAHVELVAPIMLLGAFLLVSSARGLDALTLGEDTAASLGIDLGLLRLKLVLGTALTVGSAVAVSGAIGFVGLVVPHMLRALLGPDHRLLLPASMFGGATLLVLCDTLARTALVQAPLPTGAVTAVLGGPFFIAILVRGKRYAAMWGRP